MISSKYRMIKNKNFWILVTNDYFLENKKKIFTISNLEKINQISFPIHIEFITDYSNFNKKNNKNPIILVDSEKIQFPLFLRTWRKGDIFFPCGIKGKKKLSKYYKDKKFSLLKKERTWLLVDKNESIILIIGHRLDKRFKVTKKTKKILGIHHWEM